MFRAVQRNAHLAADGHVAIRARFGGLRTALSAQQGTMKTHALLAASLLALTACSSQPAATPAAQAAPLGAAAITATSTSPQAVEHFKKGQELFDNLRTTEAAAEF